jgi:hypothetical protein
MGRRGQRGSRHEGMMGGMEPQHTLPERGGAGFLRQEGVSGHARTRPQMNPGGFVGQPERDLRQSSRAADTKVGHVPNAQRSLWAGKEGSGGGLNRWDRVSLSDDRSTQKFQRLMGAQSARSDPPDAHATFAVQSEGYYEQVAHEGAVTMSQAVQQQRFSRTSGLR